MTMTALVRFAQRITEARARVKAGASATNEAKGSSPAPSAPVAAPPASKDNPLTDRGSATKYRVTAAIPAGARVAGDLVLEESIILGGVVDGRLRISGQGMAAFVAQGGVVHGGIKAPIVLVYGEVHGLIEAEYVRVYPGGRVEGAIDAASMMVEKGAMLLNAEMRIAPPISASPSTPVDIKSAIRPASSGDSKALADAIAALRSQQQA